MSFEYLSFSAFVLNSLLYQITEIVIRLVVGAVSTEIVLVEVVDDIIRVRRRRRFDRQVWSPSLE